MRRLYGSLLLPFFLLLSQQGELRHEISHLAQPAKSQQQLPAGVDHCDLCLAFGHLAGAARMEVVAPALLSDLAFHYAAVLRFASAETVLRAPRSRGPPAL
jgi:hypothetical protein